MISESSRQVTEVQRGYIKQPKGKFHIFILRKYLGRVLWGKKSKQNAKRNNAKRYVLKIYQLRNTNKDQKNREWMVYIKKVMR